MIDKKQIARIKMIALIGFAAFIVIKVVKHYIPRQTPVTPTPKVMVQKPKSVDVTEFITQTGTVVAYNAVDLVARIKGYLYQVEFTDGTFVKKGKELFVIEPEPYLEKLKEAQASVAIAKAAHEYNQSEYARQKNMYKQNATSLNNVEKWMAKTLESKAEIDKNVANEVVASINYSYTHVQAPFDGRIGRHLVDPGNLVGDGLATDLATIEQISPIYVYLNLNELDLIKIRKIARNNALSHDKITKIPVYINLQDESESPMVGQLDFVNTSLNASTGTMEFRALLDNKDYRLLPGLFVQVKIPVSKKKLQLTIPSLAIQYDQIGPYVLVVDKNQYVVVKRLVTGTAENGVSPIVKGLDAEDDVIVSGVQNAIPGGQVDPIQSETKAA